MSGVGDFRAAIEEEKRKARERDLERKRSVSQQVTTPVSATPISPTTWAGNPLGRSSGPLPGLAYDWATTDGLESVSEIPSQPGEEEASVATLGISDEARPAPTGNSFAGLVSARKRSRVEDKLEEHVKPQRPKQSPDENDEDIVDKPLKRPFAPPKKPSRASRPTYDEIVSVDARTTSKPGDWYQNVDMRQKYSRSDLIGMQLINTMIKDCQKLVANRGDPGPMFAKIRQRLHQMEFYDFLTGVIVKKSKVLEDDVGLPQIFCDTTGVQYPWDIKDDAHMLYTKWMQGIFDPYLLRGIDSNRKQRTAGKTSMSHRLEKDYPGRVSCNVVGANGLHNGQWWPMQICAMRDGGHGEIEAGIHGQPGKGAFSIILSGGGYDDQDDGERILYCGTSGSEGKPTAGTNHLKETHRLRNPLRVLRSSALPPSNPWRPAKGLRYDGLYDIVDYEIIDEPTAMHRFSLRRRPDQRPIRHRGVEIRPTNEEQAQFSHIRHLLGLHA